MVRLFFIIDMITLIPMRCCTQNLFLIVSCTEVVFCGYVIVARLFSFLFVVISTSTNFVVR